MNPRTKLGLITLAGLGVAVAFLRLTDFSQTFSFEFRKDRKDVNLENIIRENIEPVEGSFAVYIEELPASPSAALKDPRKYALNELEVFPSASLYKLILLAAVYKEVEEGQIKLEEVISADKAHLIEVMGEEDFGYENQPPRVSFTVEEALQRVGRISDNFAAIMLTERLAKVPQKEGEDGLLIKMTRDLGMRNTDFFAEPITTTAYDIAVFFKALYAGQIVSSGVSSQIVKTLELNQLNNRLPAKLPEGVKVVHKTGELARLRHDAGIVYPPPNTANPYVIVLLSKDLKFEDNGIDTLANISKEVYEYFAKKVEN